MPTAQQLTEILNAALQKLWQTFPSFNVAQASKILQNAFANEDIPLFKIQLASNQIAMDLKKDFKELSTKVDPCGDEKQPYGASIVISQQSAVVVWFIRDAEVETIGLRSVFEKDQAPANIQFYKSLASWDYHLFGDFDSRNHAANLFQLIAQVDPAYIVLHTPELFCPIRHSFERTWAFEDGAAENTLKAHPKTVFEQEVRPPERRRTCMLMVTHACNLNCVYCYEKFKDSAEMSFETAKQAILTEAQYVKDHRDKFDELEIDFMGGEPLMNMTLIKQVVEWLENEHPIDIPYICFATTNGTLIEENATWIEQHKQTLCLGISYDGRSHHTRNRGERAKKVPLKKCHDWWPYQGFHMTLSKDSIHTFGEDIKHLHQHHPEFHITAALAQGVDWDENDVVAYAEQLEILAKYYLNPRRRQDIRPVNLLMRNLGPVSSQNQNEPQKKFCGSGSGMITYDTDGRTYGCHMFTPIVMGDAKAQQLQNCDFACWDMALEDPVCTTCFLKNYCPTCLGFNYHFRGNIRERDKRQCRMYFVEIKATCEFQLRYFAKRPPVSPEDASILRGALDAYPLLKRIADTSTYPFIINP